MDGMNQSLVGSNSSSQESLPLSQETYLQLIRQVPVLEDLIRDGPSSADLNLAENFPAMEEFPESPPRVQEEKYSMHYPSTVPQEQYAPSSLPASEIWPGGYGFTISFNPQENVKGAAWIYSEIKNKLYVGKDVPCPINFSTEYIIPGGTFIRAMPLFSSADHSADLVQRCVNHSMKEIQQGLEEAEHLVRCESKMACYCTDPVTARHSVIVPYENPAAGQNFSSYLYKFACFGSCSGGPNRRPLMLIFTLENGGRVIGRQKVDLKICACPARDKRLEEKQLFPEKIKLAGVKRKEPYMIPSALTPDLITNNVPNKKSKVSPNKNGYYTVKVRDEECYKFLKGMKRYFYIMKTVKELHPRELRLMVYSSLSSSDEAESNKIP